MATLPDPGLQNQTDDFAGKIAHSVNLALKGIVAVAAMGQIAEGCGEQADAVHFRAKARQFIAYWLKHAQAPGRSHLGLTYRRPGRRAWGNTYNAYPDALLGTGLVPDSVAAEQAAFYRTKTNRFGLPLQTPHRYGKTDWQMWLAAWLHRYPISQELIEREYQYANTTRAAFRSAICTTRSRAIRCTASRPGRCRAGSSRCSRCTRSRACLHLSRARSAHDALRRPQVSDPPGDGCHYAPSWIVIT